jgi:hypothetical protein
MRGDLPGLPGLTGPRDRRPPQLECFRPHQCADPYPKNPINTRIHGRRRGRGISPARHDSPAGATTPSGASQARQPQAPTVAGASRTRERAKMSQGGCRTQPCQTPTHRSRSMPGLDSLSCLMPGRGARSRYVLTDPLRPSTGTPANGTPSTGTPGGAPGPVTGRCLTQWPSARSACRGLSRRTMTRPRPSAGQETRPGRAPRQTAGFRLISPSNVSTRPVTGRASSPRCSPRRWRAHGRRVSSRPGRRTRLASESTSSVPCSRPRTSPGSSEWWSGHRRTGCLRWL